MPTYENLISTKEVSLAIEQVFLAPYNNAIATWPQARTSIASMVAPWVHLGAVEENSPQLQINKDKFALSTGIPRVLQYQAVRGLNGTFQCTFHAKSNRIVKQALGHGVNQINTGQLGFAASATIGSVLAGEANRRCYVGTVQVNGLSLQIGDVIMFGTSALDQSTAGLEAEVLTTQDLTPGWIGFTQVGTGVTIAMAFDKVKTSRVAVGTSKLGFFSLIGFADFIDGTQVAHYLGRVSPAGDWTEKFGPDQNPMVNAQWDIFGYTTGVYSGVSNVTGNELILGERFYFLS